MFLGMTPGFWTRTAADAVLRDKFSAATKEKEDGVFSLSESSRPVRAR